MKLKHAPYNQFRADDARVFSTPSNVHRFLKTRKRRTSYVRAVMDAHYGTERALLFFKSEAACRAGEAPIYAIHGQAEELLDFAQALREEGKLAVDTSIADDYSEDYLSLDEEENLSEEEE